MKEDKIDGLKQAIDALKGLDAKSRLRIIAEIALNDPKLAEKIKGAMVEFEDIAKLSPADFAKLKQKMESKTFHTALRKTSESFLQKIKNLMSERAYANLLEDIAAIGPQKLSHVQDCQQETINVLRSMVDRGELSLTLNSGDEEYVA